MNIGIRLHDTRTGDLDQRLGCAERQGFACAHLAMSKAVPGFSMDQAAELLTDELASQVRESFEKHQMQCAVLGCYLSLTDTNEESRERTRAIYRAHFRFANRIGAGVVGSETRPAKGCAFREPPEVSEEAYRLFIQCLRPIVRDAEEENAVFAIEPVFCHIVSTPERAQRMLEEIQSDHLQIILDAVNLLSPQTADRADEIIQDAIGRLGERVRILHMKDYLPVEKGDERLRCCACGLGEMRYERLLRFADQRGLPMTLENTTPENAEQARLYLESIHAHL